MARMKVESKHTHWAFQQDSLITWHLSQWSPLIKNQWIVKCTEKFTAKPALFCLSLLPFCRAQSQSQPVTKETDEKLLYIHTHPYTYHTLLCSLSLSHTHWISVPLSLSRPRKLHTHCGYDNSNPRHPTLSLPIYPPPVSVGKSLSSLVYPCLSICLWAYVWLCVCMCAQAGERAGVEPSNGHTLLHTNCVCQTDFMN